MLWRYDVRNIDLPSDGRSPGGIGGFAVLDSVPAGVQQCRVVGLVGSGGGVTPNSLSDWHPVETKKPKFYSDGLRLVYPGETARFEIDTDPVPIKDSAATIPFVGLTLNAGGMLKAPDAPPVVEIVQAVGDSLQSTDKLRVAKWENAFELAPFNNVGERPVRVKPGFIDNDRDRYYLRVSDLTKNKNPNQIETVRAKVKTSRDDGNDLTLTETGPDSGVFLSKSLMLMSNRIDDEYQVDGVADNAPEDRTHVVRLGDKVTASYPLAKPAVADVPVKFVVKLNPKILKDRGVPVVTLADVARSGCKTGLTVCRRPPKIVPTGGRPCRAGSGSGS